MFASAIGTSFASLLFQVAQAPSGKMSPDQIHDIAMEALKNPHSGGQNAVAIMVPLAFFATTIAILWLLLHQRQERIQARTQFHKHLLDKFSSGREFSEFLESKGSQRFLEELWSQSKNARERILTAMQNGIVLVVLGLGMLGLSVTRRGFLVPAVLVLALGVGFLISTAISYRLSRQWEHPENAQLS